MSNSPNINICLKGKTFYDQDKHCIYLVIDEYTHRVPTTGEEEPMVVYSKLASIQVYNPIGHERYCKFNLGEKKYVSFKPDFYYQFREIITNENNN